MSMTPAEMREMAASRVRELHGHPVQEVVAGIMALPLPDTTAADDALEKARAALEPFASDEASDWDMTVPDGYRPASGHWVCRLSTGDFRRAREALAAIGDAKAKGGG